MIQSGLPQSRMPVHNSRYLKASNRRRILRLIRRGPVARSELAFETGLTRAAMTRIVGDLIEEGLLVESGRRSSAAGRKPVLVELRPDYACAMGLTLSRTGAAVGLIDLAGRLLLDRSVEIAGAPRSTALRHLKQGLRRILAAPRPAGSRMLGLGISAPGPIDTRNGTVLNPPNFDLWHGANLVAEFREICGDNVFLENNSTALTMAEKAYGKGRECGNFLLLVVESGIGAGIVQRGELYRGWHGFGSEVGHTSVNLQGPVCGCGLPGCVELYASVPNVLRRAREQKPGITSWQEFVNLALEGDRFCQRLLEGQARALGTAIVNVLNVLELEAVVLTGDILCRGELLRSLVERFINQSAINRRLHRIPVYLSPLVERAELMAAAAIVTEAFFQGDIGAETAKRKVNEAP